MVSINNNPGALRAQFQLKQNEVQFDKTQLQLSSGLKSPDPSDNPSTAAVSFLLKAQIAALQQASANAANASSLIQLGAGALASTNNVLTRMQSLAQQSISASSATDRQTFNEEFQLLMGQVDNNARINWGQTQLFTGGAGHANGVSNMADQVVQEVTLSGQNTSAKIGISADTIFPTLAEGVNGASHVFTNGDDVTVDGTDFTAVVNHTGGISTANAHITATANGTTTAFLGDDQVLSFDSKVASDGVNEVSFTLGAETFTYTTTAANINTGTNIVFSGTNDSSNQITFQLKSTAIIGGSAAANAAILRDQLNAYLDPNGANKVSVANYANDSVDIVIDDKIYSYTLDPNALPGNNEDIIFGSIISTTTYNSIATTDTIAVTNLFNAGAILAGAVEGTASAINVTGTDATSYNVTVHIGSQVFSVTGAAGAPASVDTLVLTDEADSGNTITLTYGDGGGTFANTDMDTVAEFQAALQVAFGLDTGGTAASFSATATTNTTGSGDSFTLKTSSDFTSLGARTATQIAAELNKYFQNGAKLTQTSNTLKGTADLAVIGMSAGLYGSGNGGNATASNNIVSVDLDGKIFTTDLNTVRPGVNSSQEVIDKGTVRFEATDGAFFDIKNTSGAVLDADALALAVNALLPHGTIFANSNNGNGDVAQSAYALQSVVNGFSGTLGGSTTGFINGSVESVDVKSNGSNYDLSVVVGNQTFIATTKPVDSGELVLTSTTDANNKIGLTYAANTGAITTAQTFKDALEGVLGLTNGKPASFTSESIFINNMEIVPGVSTQAGNYAVRYDVNTGVGTFKLSNGTNHWTVQTSADEAITKDITFGNGVVLKLKQFDGSATPSDASIFGNGKQSTFNVTEGEKVSMSFQIGSTSQELVQINFRGMNAKALGLAGIDITTQDNAIEAVAAIDLAMKAVNSQIAELGAKKSQLTYTMDNLDISFQNQTAALSTFEDVDITDALLNNKKFEALAKIAMSSFQQSLSRFGDLQQAVSATLR